MEIEFDLTVAHRFLLTVFMAVYSLEEFPGVGGFGEVGLALVTRSLAGDNLVVGDALRFDNQRSISGVLPPGRHRLFVEAFTETVSFSRSRLSG